MPGILGDSCVSPKKDVGTIGRFVIDKLRMVEENEKTLTCVVFDIEKKTTDILLEE